MSDQQQSPSAMETSNSTSSSGIACNTPSIAPSVLPSTLHAQIDRLAHQIQTNGGNGRIVLTLAHGKVCLIDVESNMVNGECYQLI